MADAVLEAGVPCCCGAILLILCAALFGGASLYSASAEEERQEWQPTLCSVVSAPSQDAQSCSLKVQTGLTGNQTLDMTFLLRGDYDRWGRFSGCDPSSSWSSAVGASSCGGSLQALNCIGECHVKRGSAAEVVDVPDSGLLVYLPLMLLGAACACCSCLCCFASFVGYKWVSLENKVSDDSQAPVSGSCCGSGARWCVAFFLILSVALLVPGVSLLGSSEEAMWEETTCSAVTVQHGGGICAVEVQTGLSGAQNLRFSSHTYMDIWVNASRCAGIQSKPWVTSGSTPCDTQQPSGCTGKCWVADDFSQVYTSAGGGFLTFLAAAVVTFFGFSSLACCGVASASVPLVGALSSPPEEPPRPPPPLPQEVSLPDSSAPPDVACARSGRKGVDFAKLRRIFRVSVAVIGYLFTCAAICGAAAGLFFMVVLLYIARRFGLDTKICLAGAVIAGLSIVLVLVVWCALAHLRAKGLRLLDDLALDCQTQQEVQRKILCFLLRELQSERGEPYRQQLVEKGLGPEVLERVLTSPPEEMPQAFLEAVGISIILQFFCDYAEGQLRGLQEQVMGQFAMAFVGIPGFLTVCLLWNAEFSIRYEPSILSSVVSLLVAASYACLYLRYAQAFSGLQVVLTCILLVAPLVSWAQLGATVLSVLSWVAGLAGAVLFAILCYIWFCRLQPYYDASFEVLVEVLKIDLFMSFGCQRDPEVLEGLRGELRRREQRLPSCLRGVADDLLEMGMAITMQANAATGGAY